LRELFDELLPHFTSRFFNVVAMKPGIWAGDNPSGFVKSRAKAPSTSNFLERIHQEVSRRGRRMMFWGDIVLNYPELIKRLPKDILALNWGYEASHPFQTGSQHVCPGQDSVLRVPRHLHLDDIKSAGTTTPLPTCGMPPMQDENTAPLVI